MTTPSSPLGLFLVERLDPDGCVRAYELYAEYQEWCARNSQVRYSALFVGKLIKALFPGTVTVVQRKVGAVPRVRCYSGMSRTPVRGRE
jgi:phage/plasmid-associated DNA primase